MELWKRKKKGVDWVATAVFLWACTFEAGDSHSVGAPDVACGDMVPQHGQTLQESPPPYTLVPNSNSIFGGDKVVLKLEATEGNFKGFFIQARETEDGAPLGTFSADEYKVSSCDNGLRNAVTHKGATEKKEVTVEWEAPKDFEGDVTFRGTVVKSYTTYWTSLRSDKVTVKKRSVPEEPSETSPTATTEKSLENQKSSSSEATATMTKDEPQPVGAAASMEMLYEGCEDTKSCFGAPTNCVEKKNCKYLATYTFVGGGQYEFELRGKGGPDRFVAVGLSFDASMGDDSVVVCGSKDGEVDVYMTWNEGKSNKNVLNPKKGLQIVEAADIDGKLYCKFRRNEVTDPNNKEFDLGKERFHVMVAEGPLSQDNRLQYHGSNRVVSASPTGLGETSNLSSGIDTALFRLLHGCLMIGAWISAASCGIIFARYFKKTWLQSKCCNLDQWFHYHRFFMVTTWGLTIAALVLIWYALGEFRDSIHSIIGIVSVALCFIQPFMAACRPHPSAKNRSIFNWAHWFVGNSAQILGIAAIFFGFEMYFGAQRNWVKEVAWYTLIVFIGFHCIIHLVLSIAQCISDRKPKNPEVFPLKELSGNRTIYDTEDVRMDAPHGCFRKFVLGIYLPINWLFTALLIILVAVERETIEKQLTEWNFPAFWEDV